MRGVGAVAVLLGVLSCLGGSVTGASGPTRCLPPADRSVSLGCALVSGTVVGPRDEPLPEIEGAVRPTPSCRCNLQAIQVDSGGRFSVTIHRREAGADTGTAVILMSASAPRYPRHVTGAPYFDTVSVHLQYAAINAVVQPLQIRLRIPLPTP